MGGIGSTGDGVVEARLMETGNWGCGRLDVCRVNLVTSADTLDDDAVGCCGVGLMLCGNAMWKLLI